MYQITDEVKALFESEQRQVLRITGMTPRKIRSLSIYSNGSAVFETGAGQSISVYSGNTEVFSSGSTAEIAVYSDDRQVYSYDSDDPYVPFIITEADVVEGGFSIDRYACNGDRLEIGTAVAAELSLKLDNRDGRFDDMLFEGMEMFVEIGVADWTLASPTVYWMPCGYFTPDEQPRRLSTISIHALDRMTRFDAAPPTLIPWETDAGEYMTTDTRERIYFLVDIALPKTVSELIEDACMRFDVPFTQDISALPNADYVISALPTTQQAITFRNLIQWCAGLMGTNAWIDWNGELRFSWYDNATGYVSTVANRFNSDLYESPIVITGVEYMNDYDDVYLAGTDDYTLDLSGNALFNDLDNQTITRLLGNIYNVAHDFAYTPFSATVISAPYLWPMDRVTFTDKDGSGHVTSLTNVNFGLNGATAIEAKGETAQTASGTYNNTFTTQQAQELKRIQRANSTAMSQAVDHATQMITGGLGGYVVLNVNEENGQTEEILIMDSPDKETAVNVWRFNAGGLGHSSNGYNGPYADVALTADGQINANMITTGTLKAGIIDANSIALQQLTPAARHTIEDAGTAANGANYRAQTVYISRASGTTSQAANTTWVTNTTGNQNVWTTVRPAYDSSYPVLFVATQRQTVAQSSGTACSCTTPAIDQTTTVIDGGHITTGEMSAARIKGGTLTLGGVNNASGILQILDGNGDVIGTWDKGGIAANVGMLGDFNIKEGGLTFGTVGEGSTGARINKFGVQYSRYDSDTGETLGSQLREGELMLKRYGLGEAHLDVPLPYGGLRLDLWDNASGNTRMPLQIIDDSSDRRIMLGYVYRVEVVRNLSVGGTLTVTGTKSRVVSTDQYSDRLLYCYETPSPMFGDVGEGVIAEDGRCWVWLDPIFAQTISTDRYQVFLQRYGAGDCYIAERKGNCFIVEGTPGLAFGWEIKARQSGYDQRRLDSPDKPFEVPEQGYGWAAVQHIQDIEKERETA